MISVLIPALNEAATVGAVVAFARRAPRVSEIIVIDDGSTDGTPGYARAAGATVLTSSLLGKGASMEDGLRAARNEVVVYLDADLRGLKHGLIQRLTAPLFRGQADFVKARFLRAAGRVTALTARPLLRTFFPELAHLDQPLGGLVAARRSLLEQLRFENDYGVDVGLLIDAAQAGARLAEVDVGRIDHDSQSLEALTEMATQVTRAILFRAARAGRLGLAQLTEVEEAERRGRGTISHFVQQLGALERLALFDMDGVLLDGRYVVELAHRTGQSDRLARLLDNDEMTSEDRTARIASLFVGVPLATFEQTAREMPLMAGAIDTIVALRAAGYRVGVVSDSYRVATEIVRRRVFADFSVANLMGFRYGEASGLVTHAPDMAGPSGSAGHGPWCQRHAHCKVNTLTRLVNALGLDPSAVLAVGDGENDVCMLRAAGTSVAFQPKTEHVRNAADHVVEDSLTGVLGVVGLEETTGRPQPAA